MNSGFSVPCSHDPWMALVKPLTYLVSGEVATDENGEVIFRGYLGDYEVIIQGQTYQVGFARLSASTAIC